MNELLLVMVILQNGPKLLQVVLKMKLITNTHFLLEWTSNARQWWSFWRRTKLGWTWWCSCCKEQKRKTPEETKPLSCSFWFKQQRKGSWQAIQTKWPISNITSEATIRSITALSSIKVTNICSVRKKYTIQKSYTS